MWHLQAFQVCSVFQKWFIHTHLHCPGRSLATQDNICTRTHTHTHTHTCTYSPTPFHTHTLCMCTHSGKMHTAHPPSTHTHTHTKSCYLLKEGGNGDLNDQSLGSRKGDSNKSLYSTLTLWDSLEIARVHEQTQTLNWSIRLLLW